MSMRILENSMYTQITGMMGWTSKKLLFGHASEIAPNKTSHTAINNKDIISPQQENNMHKLGSWEKCFSLNPGKVHQNHIAASFVFLFFLLQSPKQTRFANIATRKPLFLHDWRRQTGSPTRKSQHGLASRATQPWGSCFQMRITGEKHFTP